MATACEPLIRGAVRDVDLAVRYGDGRFLVFLPHTDLRGAEAVGRRIVGEIRNCRLRAGGVEMMLTASVGIATPRPGKPPLVRAPHSRRARGGQGGAAQRRRSRGRALVARG